MTFKTRSLTFLTQLTLIFIFIIIAVLYNDGFIVGEIISIAILFAVIVILNRFVNYFLAKQVIITQKRIKVRSVQEINAPEQIGFVLQHEAIQKAYFTNVDMTKGTWLSKGEPYQFPALVLETLEGTYRLFLNGFYKSQVKDMFHELRERRVPITNDRMIDEFKESFYTGIHMTHQRIKPVVQLGISMGFFILYLLLQTFVWR